MTPDGNLSTEGIALKADVEERTDRIALSAFAVLDDDEVDRHLILLLPLAARVTPPGKFRR